MKRFIILAMAILLAIPTIYAKRRKTLTVFPMERKFRNGFERLLP